jgi:hypothetical protein
VDIVNRRLPPPPLNKVIIVSTKGSPVLDLRRINMSSGILWGFDWGVWVREPEIKPSLKGDIRGKNFRFYKSPTPCDETLKK